VNSLIVAGEIVLMMNEDRRVLRDGGVYVEDDKIVEVGPYTLLKSKYRPDRTIGGRKKLIMPGFVNTHDHYEQVLLRQLGDDEDLLSRMRDVSDPIASALEMDELYIGAKICMAEQIKSGITTVFDDTVPWLANRMSKVEAVDVIAKAARELGGIRVIQAVGGLDNDGGLVKAGKDADLYHYDPALARNDCINLIRKHNTSQSNITIWSNASTPLFCTDEMYQIMKEVADEYGTGTYSHVGETVKEFELVKRRTGKTEIEYLDSLGFLDTHVLLAHAVWITDTDITRIKRTDTKVSHQPICNQHRASGTAPVPKMIKEGITVGLGIDDGGHSNEDFFALMKHFVLIHRAALLDTTSTSATKALEMATIDGARALGMDRFIGSLEPGKKADLIVVDLAGLNYVPHLRPIMALVYGGMSTDVETTIINGTIVMENRQITANVKEEELMNEAEEAASNLVRRANLPHKYFLEC